VRTYDVVGRYGGEEFLIVLPGCPRNEIEASADRIRTAIGNKPIVTASAELLVTASIGAALLPADGAASEDQILLEVDQALYLAKNNGRNRVWLA
jgi:diguanylate cyclase (GGDEF)-like protein